MLIRFILIVRRKKLDHPRRVTRLRIRTAMSEDAAKYCFSASVNRSGKIILSKLMAVKISLNENFPQEIDDTRRRKIKEGLVKKQKKTIGTCLNTCVTPLLHQHSN